MPIDFENITFSEANQLIQSVKSELNATLPNKYFVEGDDWQNGNSWVGPQFEGNSKLSRELKSAIERGYTPKGNISGVVRRHRRGVIGRVPGWNISLRKAPANPAPQETNENQPLVDEAQEILNEFWKVARVHKTLKKAVTEFLATGRAPLRLFFVQSGETETEAVPTIGEAVQRIRLFLPDTGTACVITDNETLRSASFYRYESNGINYIEMSFVNAEGMTVFKTLSQNDKNARVFASANLPTLASYMPDAGGEGESDGIEIPLGGKLLVFEMQDSPLVTPAMRAQQKLVNKGCTMLSHNLDAAGFRERVYLNSMPPGAVELMDGQNVFVPDPEALEVGAGKVSYTQGLKVVERDVNTGKIKTSYTSPQVFESDPVPVKTFTDTIEVAGDAILEEADQKHIAISGDATASGESRIQARDDYRQSLEDTKSELDDVMSDASEAVLAIVAYLMGNPDRYTGLQVSFNAILNPGPISADERRVAMEEGEKQYRSDESVMEHLGINDPDAMKAKIAEEQKLKAEENPNPDPNPADPNNPDNPNDPAA